MIGIHIDKKTFIFDISKVNNILKAGYKNMVECS